MVWLAFHFRAGVRFVAHLFVALGEAKQSTSVMSLCLCQDPIEVGHGVHAMSGRRSQLSTG